jgi:hypothetical protein
VRRWGPALTLFWLAPLTGEIFSGSTPLNTPFSILFLPFLPPLYGCGALLARELLVRHHKSWRTLFLFGLAYGVMEEGFMLGSLFNPTFPPTAPVAGAATFLGVQWVWALTVLSAHVLLSIAIPILLVEVAFPEAAGRPLLAGRRLWLAVAGYVAAILIGTPVTALILAAAVHISFPLGLPWLLAPVAAAGLVVLGLRQPSGALISSEPGAPSRRAFILGLAVAFLVLPLPFLLVRLPVFAVLSVPAGWLLLYLFRREVTGKHAVLSLVSGVLTMLGIFLVPLNLLQLNIGPLAVAVLLFFWLRTLSRRLETTGLAATPAPDLHAQ